MQVTISSLLTPSFAHSTSLSHLAPCLVRRGRAEAFLLFAFCSSSSPAPWMGCSEQHLVLNKHPNDHLEPQHVFSGSRWKHCWGMPSWGGYRMGVNEDLPCPWVRLPIFLTLCPALYVASLQRSSPGWALLDAFLLPYHIRFLNV